MNSIELFAGAGGLALGIAQAGFLSKAIVEFDHDACETVRWNRAQNTLHINKWPDVIEADVRSLDYCNLKGRVELLAGGPPCQPFSLGGKHRGISDSRNMFPEMARAMRILKPMAVIIENVKGLLRESFSKHFEYILLQLTYPSIHARKDEGWESHLERLEALHTSGKRCQLKYNFTFRLLNAADYGIPQQRHRVFMVGFRSDLAVEWSFPSPTHSLDALLYDQYVTGQYWDIHRVAMRKRPECPEQYANRLSQLSLSLFPPKSSRWLTVRDAIADLQHPMNTPLANHDYQPGARAYPGHTGSPWDLPAKALKAGDHGVPGGENMLREDNGHVRYFTVRESARLQTFPDSYVFPCSWTESMRQLGNAVPVELGRIIASAVKSQLLKVKRQIPTSDVI